MTRRPDELDRWLTLERIALSDFTRFVLFNHRDAWSRDADAATWMANAIRLFACGGCIDLAIAIATETGAAIAAIRYKGDPAHEIAHAFLYDPTTDQGADILGRRPVAAIVSEFRAALGDISIHLIPLAETEPLSADDQDRLAEIGAALPWMPRRRPPTDFARFRRLVSELDHSR